ncbi:MAG: hypothetical protein ABJE10_06705 [bacterium]
MIRYLWVMLFVLATGATETLAQSTPDSVAIWTSQLGRGTNAARADALGGLSLIPRSALPAATQRVMIAELKRLNAQVLARTPWTEEATGDYYMSLVSAVAALETAEAYRALIPSIGVSLGVGRRVARLGDEAVPALRDLISRGYEKDVAIGTLGLVSFWADSTGAPLSAASRSDILEMLLRAYVDTTDDAQLGLLMGLRNAGDPTLLPLARALQGKARSQDDIYIANSLTPVIATLDARNRQLSLADLLRMVQRNVQSICVRAAPSNRKGICQAVQNEMTENVRHIERGEMPAARNGLTSALKAAERARDGGYITNAEYALIAGGIQEILSRLH